MPQHREVSPKDLGLTAEDQILMKLGDVFQDPEKKKPHQPEDVDEDLDSNGPGFVYRDKKKS